MTDATEPPKRRAAPGGDRSHARPSGADRQRRAEPPPASDDGRIAKVMARAGLCSRRDAETWIAAGRVAVNGHTIDSPALNVGPSDRITVDGAALPEREPTRLFLFHKPRGLVTTARDPEGRPTIFDNLPEGLPRVVSVGRLDINTEGLMLLTNDGGLARVLELPATGWLRRYRVRANGEVDQAKLDALKAGVTIDGIEYAGIEAVLDRVQGANVWLTIGLREGKNREIKRVLESLGLAVTRLIRVSFGPFQLGELVAGAAESVPTRVLREQLGPDLAAKAGVSFPDPGTKPTTSTRPDARSRAHVSALRSARDEDAQDGPRRRIERAATADRKGRAVKVERVVPVGRAGWRGEADPASRNARRFAAEQRDAVPPRPRANASDRPRPARGERPHRAGGSRFAERTGDDRRSDRTEIRRPARTRTAEDRPRARRTDETTPFTGAARQPRESGFGERPRREGGSGFEGRRRDDRRSDPAEARRPARTRAGGDEARAERSPGEKPRAFTGKPGGKMGFGSARPATGRNKSDAFKDRGSDRPRGGASKPAGFKGGRPGGDRPGGGNRPAGGGRPGGGNRPGGSGGRPPRNRP